VKPREIFVPHVCQALDNVLMESQIGLYKTELISKRGSWRSLADVELATAEYVEWFNSARLGKPPACVVTESDRCPQK
jgi:integrase-like protein